MFIKVLRPNQLGTRKLSKPSLLGKHCSSKCVFEMYINYFKFIDTCFRASTFCSLKIVSDCTLFPDLFKSVCLKLLVTEFQFVQKSRNQEMGTCRGITVSWQIRWLLSLLLIRQTYFYVILCLTT